VLLCWSPVLIRHAVYLIVLSRGLDSPQISDAPRNRRLRMLGCVHILHNINDFSSPEPFKPELPCERSSRIVGISPGTRTLSSKHCHQRHPKTSDCYFVALWSVLLQLSSTYISSARLWLWHFPGALGYGSPTLSDLYSCSGNCSRYLRLIPCRRIERIPVAKRATVSSSDPPCRCLLRAIRVCELQRPSSINSQV